MTRPVSDRYEPKPNGRPTPRGTTDAVRTPTVTEPIRNSGVKVRDRAGSTANVAPRDVVAVSVPRANPVRATGGVTAPRLNPRTGSSVVSGTTAVGYGTNYGSYYGHSHRNGHCNDAWRIWWWPSSAWNVHTSHCSVSFWWPWYWANTYWWDNCYGSTWSYRWSRPRCVTTDYWWYPSYSYCPTYYFVPSLYAPAGSIAVETFADPVPTTISYAEPAPAAGGAGRHNLPPEELAAKYVELGDFYFKAGRFAEALDAYNRARGYAPSDASVHFLAADAAFATGDYPYAAYLIAEALRLDPGMAGVDVDKRLFYGDPKQFEDQMAQLESYLAAKPYDAQAHLVRGYNLCLSDRPVAALAAFRRVLEIAPDDRAAQVFVDALNAATDRGGAKSSL